ncbi:hypothetical protein SH2C18_19180 [Clostridium sediminicola]|uniref:hypothetical protein n=1 Tax=Clostridium sediminicola TaxID=3114879 RepID=UPI0031F22CDE
MNIMKEKLWRVPVVSVITGVTIAIITHVSTFFIVKGTSEFTIEMGNTIMTVRLILSLVLFLGTGVMCFKDMNKKEIAKSAAIVSIYYVVVFALEQVFQAVGLYSLMMIVELGLFVPLEIYSGVLSVLMKATNINVYLLMVPMFFLPFLYVLFGKQRYKYYF